MEELCGAMMELLTKPYEQHMIDFLCDAEHYFMLIGAAPLHVELPSVEIKLEGTAPSPAEKYKILLKAEGSLTSPMPSGSTDEGYVLSIKGSGTEKLPVLSFESPGVHTYTISQIKGSNSQCSYDETVYTMKVYVTNNENGPGLVSEIVLTVPGMDGKPEHIIFVNNVY